MRKASEFKGASVVRYPSDEVVTAVKARRKALQKIIDTSDDKDKVEWAKDELVACIAI